MSPWLTRSFKYKNKYSKQTHKAQTPRIMDYLGESKGAGSELQAVQKEKGCAKRRVMERNSELTRMNDFVKTAEL